MRNQPVSRRGVSVGKNLWVTRVNSGKKLELVTAKWQFLENLSWQNLRLNLSNLIKIWSKLFKFLFIMWCEALSFGSGIRRRQMEKLTFSRWVEVDRSSCSFLDPRFSSRQIDSQPGLIKMWKIILNKAELFYPLESFESDKFLTN